MSPIPEEKHLNQRRQFSQEDLNQKHCNVLIDELTAIMTSDNIPGAKANNYSNVNSDRNLKQTSEHTSTDTKETQNTTSNRSENDSNGEIQITNYEDSLPQDSINQSSENKATNDELKQNHYIKPHLGPNNPPPSGHYITLSQINSYANQS